MMMMVLILILILTKFNHLRRVKKVPAKLNWEEPTHKQSTPSTQEPSPWETGFGCPGLHVSKVNGHVLRWLDLFTYAWLALSEDKKVNCSESQR
jgi:hypothetical protein